MATNEETKTYVATVSVELTLSNKGEMIPCDELERILRHALEVHATAGDGTEILDDETGLTIELTRATFEDFNALCLEEGM